MQRFRTVTRLLFTISLGTCLAVSSAGAQDLKAKAEAEGKLMFYATFNAADSKTLIDGFKQLFPKIDAVYYRSTDSALMERILTENRAGQNLWDVVVTTSFLRAQSQKTGAAGALRFAGEKILSRRLQGPASDVDFHLHELCGLWLQ